MSWIDAVDNGQGVLAVFGGGPPTTPTGSSRSSRYGDDERMRFTFTRRDPSEPPSAFDLGDLEIVGPDGSVTSAGRRPDQSFMVYVGVVDLVDALVDLAEGKRRAYEFIGPDSSFRVDCRRERDRISAKSYGTSLGTEPVADVLAGLRAGVDSLLATDPLDPSEPGAGDLTAAMTRLRRR